MNLRLSAWLLVGIVIAAAPACGGSPGSSGDSTSQAAARPADSAMAEAPAPGAGYAVAAPPPASPKESAPQSAGAFEGPGTTASAPNSPEALEAARKRAFKTALHEVHEALLTFYAANARYPKDRKELETDAALAAAVARLEKVSTGLGYTSDGGSFTLTVKRADGPPLTISGNNQKFRRTPPPTAETPAGT